MVSVVEASDAWCRCGSGGIGTRRHVRGQGALEKICLRLRRPPRLAGDQHCDTTHSLALISERGGWGGGGGRQQKEEGEVTPDQTVTLQRGGLGIEGVESLSNPQDASGL